MHSQKQQSEPEITKEKFLTLRCYEELQQKVPEFAKLSFQSIQKEREVFQKAMIRYLEKKPDIDLKTKKLLEYIDKLLEEETQNKKDLQKMGEDLKIKDIEELESASENFEQGLSVPFRGIAPDTFWNNDKETPVEESCSFGEPLGKLVAQEENIPPERIIIFGLEGAEEFFKSLRHNSKESSYITPLVIEDNEVVLNRLIQKESNNWFHPIRQKVKNYFQFEYQNPDTNIEKMLIGPSFLTWSVAEKACALKKSLELLLPGESIDLILPQIAVKDEEALKTGLLKMGYIEAEISEMPPNFVRMKATKGIPHKGAELSDLEIAEVVVSFIKNYKSELAIRYIVNKYPEKIKDFILPSLWEEGFIEMEHRYKYNFFELLKYASAPNDPELVRIFRELLRTSRNEEMITWSAEVLLYIVEDEKLKEKIIGEIPERYLKNISEPNKEPSSNFVNGNNIPQPVPEKTPKRQKKRNGYENTAIFPSESR